MTNRAHRLAAALALACTAATVAQTRVLVLSSGDPALDAIVETSLEAQGLTATVGPECSDFTSAVSLSDVDVVYLQQNFNWASGSMPSDGQQHVLDFVNGGGGLVTCEWVQYYVWVGSYDVLEPAVPVTSSGVYVVGPTAKFDLVTSDPVMTAGVASQFTMTMTSYSGTEVQLAAKPGATVFMSTQTWPGAAGLAGWDHGSGRVASFSTVNGNAQFDSPDFVRLLANSMRWADDSGATPCFADCDASGKLDVQDFTCFQNAFALGDLVHADCDESGTLDIQDFTCFQNGFALGCP